MGNVGFIFLYHTSTAFMKYGNTYLTLGITASSRQRTRLNNKTANPELRNLCSWVEVWQDVAYSNPSSPTGNGGHVINTSPTMLYYLMVLTSFNLILGYGKWGDYEDSTARMGLKKLKYVIWQYDISHRTSHPRARKWVCTYPSQEMHFEKCSFFTVL